MADRMVTPKLGKEFPNIGKAPKVPTDGGNSNGWGTADF